MNLTPIFNEYLRHAALPVLQLRWSAGSVRYRWQADEKAFAMPVLVGSKQHWQKIQPTAEWQTMQTALVKDQFEVATDLYYIKVGWMP
jgi:hypothetical protein